VIPFVAQVSVSDPLARYLSWANSNTSPTGFWFLSPSNYTFCRVVVKVETNTADDEAYLDLLGGDPATNPATWSPISRAIIPAGSVAVAEREGTVSIPKGLGLLIRASVKSGASGGIVTPHGGISLS
jgi:hypothetical protein